MVFTSEADNLVEGDTNNFSDVFVRDRQSGTTERVSFNEDGTQRNKNSYNPSFTPDGRYVAFTTGNSYQYCDWYIDYCLVFVYDRQTGITEVASVPNGGTQGGRYSYDPTISADGRFVAFTSMNPYLVSGDTNSLEDVFVHDRQTGATELVSVDSGGHQDRSGSAYGFISADGRFVLFSSGCQYGGIAMRDRIAGTTSSFDLTCDHAPWYCFGIVGSSFSANMLYVAFANTVGGKQNVFTHDRLFDVTYPISAASDGSPGNGNSDSPSISANGRYMSFASTASNLVSEDTNGFEDVFVRDRGSEIIRDVVLYLPFMVR